MAAKSTQTDVSKPFGWQGVTCRIPAEWDLAGVSGTAREGYFAFDDERMRRFEIKYARARRWGKPDLDKTLETYFDSVRKKLGKGASFAVDDDIRLIDLDRMPPEYAARSYGWTADLVARGAVWYCPTCRRVVIAQCLTAPNRVNLREMSDVLTSVRCHAEGSTTQWAAFEFSAAVPSEFELESNRLQAGLISLSFYHKGRRLVIDRLGMAQAVLKHTPLDKYVKDIHYKKLRRRRLRFIPEEWAHHPGFRVEGEKSRLMYLIPRLGPWLRRMRPGDHVGGRVWQCDPANRLFIIRAEGKGAQALADEVARSVVCHEEA